VSGTYSTRTACVLSAIFVPPMARDEDIFDINSDGEANSGHEDVRDARGRYVLCWEKASDSRIDLTH
jgi:hypothetical protein